MASGQPVVGGLLEGELSTSPGVKRFWTMDLTPVFDREGKVVAIAAASAEITRQKHAEAILIQTEKLAAVGRLASLIAHEINNPLESVTNLLYLIRGHHLEPQVQGYIDTAERELRRVSAITNQTLRFHKQSTGPPKFCEMKGSTASSPFIRDASSTRASRSKAPARLQPVALPRRRNSPGHPQPGRQCHRRHAPTGEKLYLRTREVK